VNRLKNIGQNFLVTSRTWLLRREVLVDTRLVRRRRYKIKSLVFPRWTRSKRLLLSAREFNHVIADKIKSLSNI
jgi:hypothetical protein